MLGPNPIRSQGLLCPQDSNEVSWMYSFNSMSFPDVCNGGYGGMEPRSFLREASLPLLRSLRRSSPSSKTNASASISLSESR